MDQKLQNKLIAIVDDDVLVRAAFKDCLESADYAVKDFGSAEEFLASDCMTEADCLVLDMRLPGINGLQAQARLVELDCRLPIVFVTAHPDDETRAQAMHQGAAGFLKKPVHRQHLLNCIDAALQHGSPSEKQS